MEDEQVSTEVKKPSSLDFIKNNWKIILGVVALAGWLLSAFFGYSLKKTTDELKEYKTTHSEGVTIREPIEVAGKIVYREVFRTTLDTSDDLETKKTETIWKSGLSLGALYDINAKQFGGYGVADVLPIGPGTTQINVTAFKTGVFIGGGYRLLF